MIPGTEVQVCRCPPHSHPLVSVNIKWILCVQKKRRGPGKVDSHRQSLLSSDEPEGKVCSPQVQWGARETGATSSAPKWEAVPSHFISYFLYLGPFFLVSQRFVDFVHCLKEPALGFIDYFFYCYFISILCNNSSLIFNVLPSAELRFCLLFF